MNQTCATCKQIGILRQTTIFLGSEMAHLHGGGADENETGYVKIPMCAKCRTKLESARFPGRLWFVISGFLAVLTALGAAMWAGMARGGGGIEIGPTVVVLLLGLGTAGSFVLYRRQKERLRERLVRWLSNGPSEEDETDSPGWGDRLVESKGGKVAQALVVLMLAVGVGGLIGVIMWKAIKGISETAMATPEIFVTAAVGAVASLIGFGLFCLVRHLLGPTLLVVCEEWTMYIAPIIGGAIGAAIGDGLPVSVVYIVALGALIGGIAAVLREAITARERITRKAIQELVIAGIGLGAINGVILAIFFKVLEMTVGLWK